MTIKKLSDGALQDDARRFAGKVWCYAAVILSESILDDRWGLGVAVVDEPGYFPVLGFKAHASTYEEMMDYADDLNRQRGITRAKSAIIIASTMKGRGTTMSRERRQEPGLDTPKYSRADLAKRWSVSVFTIRRWEKAERLGKPKYLSPTKPRYSERQVLAFEATLPTDYENSVAEFEDTGG